MSVPDPAVVDWVPLGGVGSLPYATSLPASPVDGQEAVLVDSVTNPAWIWKFRFNAQSIHSHKWEFVGGTDMSSGPQGDVQYPGTAHTPWAGGPGFNAPRAGDYDIDFGCFVQSIGAGGAFDINVAVFVNPAESQPIKLISTTQYTGSNISGSIYWPTMASGLLVMLMYWGSTATTVNYARGWIRMRPRRIS